MLGGERSYDAMKCDYLEMGCTYGLVCAKLVSKQEKS